MNNTVTRSHFLKLTKTLRRFADDASGDTDPAGRHEWLAAATAADNVSLQVPLGGWPVPMAAQALLREFNGSPVTPGTAARVLAFEFLEIVIEQEGD